MEKPSLPKGTRDFGPQTMARRNFILQSIRSVFQKFGFQPLETPAMENLSTLTGKYGDEGDQLLFRILESGDFYSKTGIEISKVNYFLLRSIKHVIEEIFGIKGRFKVIKPLKQSDRINPTLLSEWIEEHYSLICKGRMKESLELKELESTLWKITSSKDLINELAILIGRILTRFSDETPSEEDIEKKIDDELFQYHDNFYRVIDQIFNYRNLKSEFSEKGLRYDLTIPFARYVVMNRHEITLPFKRYQIQPVWRADRPQKGRYREFYQCDADVVGTDSLICEAEIILMIKEVMALLRIEDYTIKINHRGVLNGIAEVMNATGKETDLFVAIDKLEKIGEENVRKELMEKGFAAHQLDKLFELLKTSGNPGQKLNTLLHAFAAPAFGKKGIDDLRTVFELLGHYQSLSDHVDFDVALARGLSYYTGCIFEVKINNVAIGSVSGGGRYDNLTQAFGSKEKLSGVGISFGIDRIYDAMDELSLFPEEANASSKVLICHFDDATLQRGLSLLTSLRQKGISSEIYPEVSKLKKQLDYANKKSIPFTIVIGEEEMKTESFTVKDMNTGGQQKWTTEQIIQHLG